MKSGLVLEIRGGRAVVLEAGGALRTVRARADWSPGDVVSLRAASPAALPLRRLAPLAACLAAAVGIGLFAHAYGAQAALISMDVNPSVELRVNRFGRVVALNSLNDDANGIVPRVSVRGRDAGEAVRALLSDASMQAYLEASPEVLFTVMADNGERQQELLDEVAQAARAAVTPRHSEARISCHAVDGETVAKAHAHDVTAGKYLLLLELQQVDPQASIEAYAHHSVGDLVEQIESCREHAGAAEHETCDEDCMHAHHAQKHGE